MIEAVPLFGTLYTNIINLYSDFITIHFSVVGIVNFLLHFSLVIILFIIFSLLGTKIRKNIVTVSKIDHDLFIDIALGYIVFGTGIFIVGILSLLTIPVICTYILLCLMIVVYPMQTVITRINNIFFTLFSILNSLKSQKFLQITICAFIVIGFLRLLVPETNVDALWYHTDNPRKYTQEQSILIKPNYQFHLVAIPQLNEMLYTLPDLFGVKHVSRYIHFMFYILVILFIISFTHKSINPKLSSYAALLFVASPVTIRHMSSALTDFPWILCWLVSIYCLISYIQKKRFIMLSGVLFGGVLATKLWTIAFTPIFIIYIFYMSKNITMKERIQTSLIFLLCAFMPASLWYIRSFLLTGNPVYPAFAQNEWFFPKAPGLSSYLSYEAIKFRIESIKNFSPLLFFGIATFIMSYKSKVIANLKKSNIFIFFLIVSASYIILPYYFGHYLYAWYVLMVIVFSTSIPQVNKKKTFSFVFSFLTLIIIFYYGTNTILTLPYGFGWANTNNYLTRVLSRDNSSYFDYDYRFSKYIEKNEKVATYRMWGFYYADFYPVFVVDILREKGAYLSSFKKLGINKLLIKGGNIEWFCQELAIKDCQKTQYKLLTSYIFSHAPASQYLYEIK